MKYLIWTSVFFVSILISTDIWGTQAINDKHMKAVLQEKKQTLEAMKLAVGVCKNWKNDYEELLITMNAYLDTQDELMEYQAYRLGIQP